MSKNLPIWDVVILNFTGLFGLLKWDAYIGTGMWSIGNELSFYVLFPILIVLLRKSQALFFMLVGVLSFAYLYFSYKVLDTGLQLSQQWYYYVNPLNQAPLFVGGVILGRYFHQVELKNIYWFVLIIFSLLGFLFMPTSEDSVSLVTGHNRIFFTFLCFSIVLGVYKVKISLMANLEKFLSYLGESSYSIYLIHPIVWSLFGFVQNQLLSSFDLQSEIKIGLNVILTLIVSNFIYRNIELRFMHLAKKITAQELDKAKA